MKTTLNLFYGISSYLSLRRERLLHFIYQRHLNVNVLLCSLNTETDMIRHRHDQIWIQFIFQLIAGDIHKLCRKMDHRLRDLTEKSDILLVDIIKRPCDQIQILKFVRRFGKPIPFPTAISSFPSPSTQIAKLLFSFFITRIFVSNKKTP